MPKRCARTSAAAQETAAFAQYGIGATTPPLRVARRPVTETRLSVSPASQSPPSHTPRLTRARRRAAQGFGFRGSGFHRVVPGVMCQGGDIERHDGSGGLSAIREGGAPFPDENFVLGLGRALATGNGGPRPQSDAFECTS